MQQGPLELSLADIYHTSLGKTLNVSPIVSKLQLLRTQFSKLDKSDLSYHLKFDNHIPVIITGKDAHEENIPLFTYPIVFYGIHEKFIAIDIRSYISLNKLNILKKMNTREINLDDIISRVEGCNFLFFLAACIDKSIDNGFEWVPNKDIVCSAFAHIYASVMKVVINLQYVENIDIKYLCILYYYTLLKGTRCDDMGSDKIKTYMNNFSKQFSLEKRDHDILIASFVTEQCNITDENYVKLSSMLELTSSTLEEDKKKIFNASIFGNALKSLWIGHGQLNTSLMCYENIPLFLTMMYSVYKYNTLKDSRFCKLLKDSKIDIKKFGQSFDMIFKYLK